ncbi:MAG TPA: hypothetical protein ACFCUD_03370 [Cyclobacteriaceae bacterium]
MDQFIELLKILIPALAVLYGMYLVMRSFLGREMEKLKIDGKLNNRETVLPIRLQAYERICLLLERISPTQIIPRVNKPDFTGRDLQSELIREIREEFNHNLSQQLYMSDESWGLVRKAKEDVITLINESANDLEEDSRGIDLARIVFEKAAGREDSVVIALNFIKNEIREIF